MVLSILMATGVILIISNTVRLGIVNRSEEIEIIDQIGGTGAFIRRPFLYYGVLQGIAGALAAILIANSALLALSTPVERLAKLYDSNLRINWIEFDLLWVVLLTTAVLGWLAARVTAGNYLRKMRASERER
jgi:cell division transport system permease protein